MARACVALAGRAWRRPVVRVRARAAAAGGRASWRFVWAASQAPRAGRRPKWWRQASGSGPAGEHNNNNYLSVCARLLCWRNEFEGSSGLLAADLAGGLGADLQDERERTMTARPKKNANRPLVRSNTTLASQAHTRPLGVVARPKRETARQATTLGATAEIGRNVAARRRTIECNR